MATMPTGTLVKSAKSWLKKKQKKPSFIRKVPHTISIEPDNKKGGESFA